MNELKTDDSPVQLTRHGDIAPGPVLSGAVLVMGASGIIAQLLLLRELLITFLSNELTIGIILANWLILEAAGSLLGRIIERSRRKLLLFVSVTGIFSVCLPLAVYFARTWKVMAGAGPGEGMGLHQVFLASFIILLPVCLTHGALFTFACRLMTASSQNPAAGIGKVYFLETVGTIAGGLIFTFLMISVLDSIEAALVVFSINVATCFLLLLVHEGPLPGTENTVSETGRREPGSSATYPKWTTSVSVLFLMTVTGFLLLRQVAPEIHLLSIQKQWQGQEVVHYQNSVYGNTAVIEREGEYTYFADGVPAITSPTPDVVFVEEFAHLPLLFQSGPEKILVISGGAGGVINELLKHPVESIDYVELDPLILKLIRKFPTDLTETELSDPRVHVHFRDRRLFLRETPARYDVILIGLSDPQDLQTNRFFTKQFFTLVSSRLGEKGVVAFTLPGSLTYMGDELKDLNASVLNALNDVFPGVRVIPGDGYNLVLGSPSADITSCDADCVRKRYDEATLTLQYLKPFFIDFRLDPRWSQWFSDTMIGTTEKHNEDFKPLAVFYSLSHWNAKFVPRIQGLFTLGGKINLAFLAGAVGFAAICLLLPVTRSRRPSRVSIFIAITATGLTGMILELAMMFTFQALYGIVFYWMGLLITSFMTGVALGSLVMTRYMERLRSDIIWFAGIETAIAVFSFLLPVVFLGSESIIGHHGWTLAVQILFLAFSLMAGFLIGVQFPLAGKIYLGSSGDVGGTAGLLYGADLLGGWVGGITGGVFLLPVIGLVSTCLFLGILKLGSGFLVAVGGWKGNYKV